MAVVECVPNISEGLDAGTLQQCARAIEAAGVPVLDLHSDPDHHRSVFTFAGGPTEVTAAALALSDVAIAAIDLNAHTGVHPRIGAVDVVPFIPIAGFTMDECRSLAQAFAADLSERHGLPVFLYEAAALHPDRRRLETIRRGGLQALTARMADRSWQPDFGPALPHPTAGVTVVGAREPLVAYNINLETDRLEVALDIARSIRESSGGLPFVKALGLPLIERGLVQVSMNLTNFHVTPMRVVFDTVEDAAARLGVRVLESEIVGLVPAAALTDADAAHLRVRDFDGSQILERRMAERGATQGSSRSRPGGMPRPRIFL